MKILKEWGPFFIVILAIILIRSYVVTPVRVDGTSMYDTLDEGNILLLEKYDQTYERFEIVVFEFNGEKLIKRVIGLPGGTIEYKKNSLSINGQKIEDEYGYGITADFNIKDLNLTKIPEGYYFLVGDNRNNSLDSRYFGCIEKNKIIGSVRYILFPFNKFGSIEK